MAVPNRAKHLDLESENFQRLNPSPEETDQFFQLLVDAVQDYAIFALDLRGRIASWNTGAQRLKGFKADEVIGTHFSRFYTSSDRALGHPEDELKQATLLGKYQEEGWRVKKDGTRFWADVTIRPILDQNGKICGFSKVTRDLTERKFAEEKLRNAYESLEKLVADRTAELVKAKNEAEEAVRMRDEFLSIASHELRTPLTSLMLQLNVFNRALTLGLAQAEKMNLSRKGDWVNLPLQCVKIASNCEEQGKKLAALLDKLLDLTRIRAGKISLAIESVDLGSLIEKTSRYFGAESEKNGCVISTQIAAPVVGQWDPLRIEQILSNLISNAIKFGEGKPILITVQRDKKKSAVQLDVRDQGVGIPKELQEIIFERFERGSAESRKTSGLGLGLYICRQLTQAHGGSISVESQPGQGAKFRVELPVTAGERAGEKANEH